MSLPVIEIHFQETAKLAVSITELAAASEQLVREELMQIIGEMNRAWQSESRTILAGKEVKAAKRLLAQTEKMKKLAEDLEAQARQLLLAELTNDLCARTRIY